MITRLPNNILHKTASKSWFVGIRLLCDLYALPSPLQLLQNPLTKHSCNKLVKSRIIDFWEKNLRSIATKKTSLTYFKPVFMSLTSPHPLFSTCTNKSTCQGALISGRYKTAYLERHWSKENPDGFCVLCPGLIKLDTLDQFILHCDALTAARTNVINYWQHYSSKDDQFQNLLLTKLRATTETLMQFIIDPSVDCDVLIC